MKMHGEPRIKFNKKLIRQLKPKYSGRSQFQCHVVHKKSHTYWPGVESGDLRNMGLEDVEWIDEGHDGNPWLVLAKLVVEFQGSVKGR